MMRVLAKAGYTQSYTYFTWRNSKGEMTEYLTELTQTQMQDYFRPQFFREYARTSCRKFSNREVARHLNSGSCSPPRSLQAMASTTATNCVRIARFPERRNTRIRKNTKSGTGIGIVPDTSATISPASIRSGVTIPRYIRSPICGFTNPTTTIFSFMEK